MTHLDYAEPQVLMKRLETGKPSIKVWVQVALGTLWLSLGSVWVYSGGAQAIESWLDRPLAFYARELFAGTPALSANLKVFAFDDRTFAKIGKPYMDSATWATITDNIAASKPRSIVFNYMFGAGEFSAAQDNPLAEAMGRLQYQGIRTVGASIPYPGEAKFKEALPLAHPEFSLPSSFASINAPYTDRRGFSLYGPPRTAAPLFHGFGHTIYHPRGTVPAALVLSPDRAVSHLALATTGQLGFTKTDIFVKNQALPVDRHGELSIDFVTPIQYSRQVKSLASLLDSPSKWVKPGDTVLVLSNFYTGGSSFASTPFGTMPTGWITMAAIDTALRGQWVTPWGASSPWLLLGLALGWWIGRIRSPTFFWLTLATACALILLGSALMFTHSNQLVIWSAASPTMVGMAVHMWTRRMQLQIQASQQDRLQHARETARLNAVVRTAQMFAHDVRRPFRLVQMARESFKMTSDPRKIREKVEALLPELESAVGTVEAMVRDLMDFDGQLKLQRRDRYLEDLIALSLQQVCRGRPHLRLRFSYSLAHSLMIYVDETKLLRVLTNLIENAIDACGTSGHIWFHAEDVQENDKTQVLLTIGNEGSVIPEEKQQQIFEAFYTSGKKGGTGLGLAIAKQIVVGHGGNIWCKSHPTTGTEFSMTLPIAHATPYTPLAIGHLPESSDAFQTVVQLSERPKKATKHSAGRATLAVVDDSLFTLEAWKEIVTDADVKTFLSPKAFWDAVAQDQNLLESISIVVTDYYFDNDAVNGVGFAKAIRAVSDIPVFLSTDGAMGALPPEITDRIAKEPIAFALLQHKLSKVS